MQTAPSILLLLFAGLTSAKLLYEASELSKTGYDFIIVGAGTAGCVLANRLTAVPNNFTVLVLEAGGDDQGILGLEVPAIAPSNLANESLIWDYTTVEQSGLNNRSLAYQRGHVLGGSSSINFMYFTRGSRDDYDRFANFTDDSSWSWDNLFPYMLKAENFVQPVNRQTTVGRIIPEDHGHSGPLQTTTTGFPFPFDDLVVQTSETHNNTFNFSRNPDHNSGDTIGTSWIQSTSGHGMRSSSATAYLHPVLDRDNLHVLIGAQVTKLYDVGGKTVPDLRKLTFVTNETGVEHTVDAAKEIVLAAGAVNSPQLLLLSGIGDSEELAAHNITPLVQLPAVGKQMQDHPLFSVQFTTDSTETLDSFNRNTTAVADALEQWKENRTGFDTSLASNLFSWVRLPDDSDVIKTFGDASAGPTSGHIELLSIDYFISFSGPAPDNGTFITMTLNVASPASRGQVQLNSSDPLEFPLIDPAFLTNGFDVDVMVAAIHAAEDFLGTAPWAGMNLQRFGAWANATTDDELADVARAGIVTFWHPCCTARMGKEDDDTAVVTSKLLVKGVTGLRVVDASVFPFIPAAHLQAPVYAIAERAVDIILDAHANPK
ncbi:GMC oxidoreductase [Peniophora sp. CONT]|nr:GMC oxidoreductase [Peniophora sp. CONT]